MIHNPIDVSTHVTPRLSALIEVVVNNPDGPEEPTLDTVRHYFTDLLPSGFDEAERMHRFDINDSILDELNTLIEEYGADAPAVDFMRCSAGEGLTRSSKGNLPFKTFSELVDALIEESTSE